MFSFSKLTEADRLLFEQLVFHEAVMKMNYGRPFTPEEAAILWRSILSLNGNTGVFGYEKVLLDDVFIGVFGLTEFDGGAEVEYMLLPQYWGKGYATVLLALQIEHLRKTTKIPLLRAITDPDNRASVRVLEKTGFRFVEFQKNPNEEQVGIFELKLSEMSGEGYVFC